jgi:hypothetical protein
VRFSPDGQKADVLLPLYLTRDHFQRALPALAKSLAVLAPEHAARNRGTPPPEAWLEVGPGEPRGCCCCCCCR